MNNEYFATANGSFSIYKFDHSSIEEVYNSGNLLDHIVAAIGHYPESQGNE